jgi:purine-binding chemotaxis protein CheW
MKMPTMNDRYISFTLAGERYALAFASVREILPAGEATPVPLAPDDVLGVINLRNNVVSIVDLRIRFAMPSPSTSHESPVLILENHGALLGIAVDTVDAALTISSEQLSPPPEHSSAKMMRFADWVARLDRQLVVILSSEKLFSFEDRKGSAAKRSSSAAA